MNRNTDLLNGVVLGAGLMYLLDPDRGRRRRAMVRDQAVHLVHQAGDGAGTAARDLANRSKGLAAEAGSLLRRGSADDTVVEARVRSELGRLVSHPGAIHVMVRDGHVTLSGPVLEDEVEQLVSGVAAVRGVKAVENQLLAAPEPGDIPGLQGRSRKPQSRPELMQEHWAPATRLVMGTLGGALALQGARSRGALGTLFGALGMGLLTRALTNMEAKRLLGVDAGRRAVDLHKIVNVRAPVAEVFAFWSNYENFPRFMSHLKEVRLMAAGRSHWVAEGPGGISVSWDAETTAHVSNEVIAWRSIGGSPVQNAGIVRFQENPDGSTRVDIRMSYNPPAGALGHAVAWLFGMDARHLMDDDLVRFKSLLELGKTRADGRAVTREELETHV